LEFVIYFCWSKKLITKIKKKNVTIGLKDIPIYFILLKYYLSMFEFIAFVFAFDYLFWIIHNWRACHTFKICSVFLIKIWSFKCVLISWLSTKFVILGLNFVFIFFSRSSYLLPISLVKRSNWTVRHFFRRRISNFYFILKLIMVRKESKKCYILNNGIL
jgi:hypothetical protein